LPFGSKGGQDFPDFCFPAGARGFQALDGPARQQKMFKMFKMLKTAERWPRPDEAGSACQENWIKQAEKEAKKRDSLNHRQIDTALFSAGKSLQ
jgi:hypothetical protein